ncbi:hypothetical protein [Marinobacter sp. CA1]|uniref:hypothetical protein n=1 Tax=Marinobacter sp. CA1 TaxID=2817656 RepID=UPI001D072263|nr:hypothetical protein [Marinobacter sp. CA1]MCG8520363.1 hypothetical protein [Pseudomonadales bacterium]UDL04926.1 hypothetical protein J2887_20065 [Marinobacter sp. CA1]
MNRHAIVSPAAPSRAVDLDQHDSVRSHVNQRIHDEVAQLERRIESLRLVNAPYADLMITTYQRMLDRKRGFIAQWELDQRY